MNEKKFLQQVYSKIRKRDDLNINIRDTCIEIDDGEKVIFKIDSKGGMFYSTDNQCGEIVFTRKKFDEISNDLLEQTFEKVDEVLNYARINKKTIDRIVITGEASRMPQIRTAFIDKYKIEPQITDYSTSVAKGAALYSSGKYELLKDVWNYENSFRAKEEFEEEIKRYSDTRTYFTEEEFKEMCKHTSGFWEIIKKRTQNTKD